MYSLESKHRDVKFFIGFDLDDTLIQNEQRSTSSWTLLNAAVRTKLAALAKDDAGILIISNQAFLGGKPSAAKEAKTQKIESFYNWLLTLGFAYVGLYASTGHNTCRKPCTTIVEYHLMSMIKSTGQTEFLYVGDAAGREEDFSDSDRLFALNIEILFRHYGLKVPVKFQTPDGYFLDKEWERVDIPSPKKWITQADPVEPLVRPSQTVYFLVGPPASGKTTLCRKLNIATVSFDTDSQKVCIEKMKALLETGKSVAIDNTNASKKQRNVFLSEIPESVNKVAVLMEGERDFFWHMNVYRSKLKTAELLKTTEFKTAINDPQISYVPEVAYNVWYKNFEAPGDEFNEVVRYKSGVTFDEADYKHQMMLFMQRN